MLVINTSGKEVASKKRMKAPIVRVLSKTERKPSEKQEVFSENETDEAPFDPILKTLQAELSEILKERDKLSRSIAPKVRGYENTKVPISELEQLYNDINKLTEEGAVVYRKIEHYEKHGEMPVEEEDHDPMDTENIAELKVLKRSLENRRHKVNTKLDRIKKGGPKPKNPMKILEWEQNKLELDDQYTQVVNKIKDLSNG